MHQPVEGQREDAGRQLNAALYEQISRERVIIRVVFFALQRALLSRAFDHAAYNAHKALGVTCDM